MLLLANGGLFTSLPRWPLFVLVSGLLLLERTAHSSPGLDDCDNFLEVALGACVDANAMRVEPLRSLLVPSLFLPLLLCSKTPVGRFEVCDCLYSRDNGCGFFVCRV